MAKGHSAGAGGLRRAGRDGLLVVTLTSLILNPSVVVANPQGGVVVAGQAEFAGAPDALTVTNAPGTIIEWQQFSIAQNEITRFVQENAQSAVLNRVVGESLSEVLGRLESNGQVFLINPNGIVVGNDAVIDTAGFVASTLGMSNEDFLSGRLAFEGGANAGAVRNGGVILAREGSVIIVAPVIENSGLTRADNGDLILAAGRKVLVTDASLAGVTFEVQAPTDRVLNLGRLIARGGSIGAFAGTLSSQGTIDADSVSVGAGGEIILGASGDITLGAGSVTTASGASGGNIFIQSLATPVGSAAPGAPGSTVLEGVVRAEGTTGLGGTVNLLGPRVAVTGVASVDGAAGGGALHVGGSYRGTGPLPNADAVYVAPSARLTANATVAGDGGEVVVWSDSLSKVYGAITARGANGRGGFVETSSARVLDMRGSVDVSGTSALGELLGGTWLLDPLNLTIVAGTGLSGVTETSTNFFQPTATAATIGVNTITSAMTGGVNVVLNTNVSGGEQGDITLATPFDIDATTGANTLTLQAQGNIFINAPIFDSNPGGQVFAVDFQPGVGFETQIGASITDLGARSDFAGTTRFVASATIAGPDIGFFTLAATGVAGNIIGSIGVVDVIVGMSGLLNFTGTAGITGSLLVDAGGTVRSDSGVLVANSASIDGSVQVFDSLNLGAASVGATGSVTVGNILNVANFLDIDGSVSTQNLSSGGAGSSVSVFGTGLLDISGSGVIDELNVEGTLSGAGTTVVNVLFSTGNTDAPVTSIIDAQTIITGPLATGTLRSGALQFANGGSVINTGSLSLEGGLTVAGAGVLRNEGSFTVLQGRGSLVQLGAAFEQVSPGNTRMDSGTTLAFVGSGTLGGVIQPITAGLSGITVDFAGGNYSVLSGFAALTNFGTSTNRVRLRGTALLDLEDHAGPTYQGSGFGNLAFEGGTLSIGSGALAVIFGNGTWSGGTLTSRHQAADLRPILTATGGAGSSLQVISGGTKRFDSAVDLVLTGNTTILDDIQLQNGSTAILGNNNVHIGNVTFTDVDTDPGDASVLALTTSNFGGTVIDPSAGVTFDVRTFIVQGRDVATGARLSSFRFDAPVTFLRDVTMVSSPLVNFSGGITFGPNTHNVFSNDPGSNPLGEVVEIRGDTPSDALVVGAGAELALLGTGVIHRVTTLQLDAGASLVGPGGVDTNFFELLSGGNTLALGILQSSDLATFRGATATTIGGATQLQIGGGMQILSGTNLVVNGSVQTFGTTDIFGATLGGTGLFVSNSVLNVISDANPLVLDALTFTSAGSADIANNLVMANGARLELMGASTLRAAFDTGTGGVRVVNNGTADVFGTAAFNGVTFDNFGQVRLDANATLLLGGGGTLAGTFVPISGGLNGILVDFTAGNYSIQSGFAALAGSSGTTSRVRISGSAVVDLEDHPGPTYQPSAFGNLEIDGGRLIVGSGAAVAVFGDGFWRSGVLSSRRQAGDLFPLLTAVNSPASRFQIVAGGIKRFDAAPGLAFGSNVTVLDDLLLENGSFPIFDGNNVHIGHVTFTDIDGDAGDASTVVLFGGTTIDPSAGVNFDVNVLISQKRDVATGARLSSFRFDAPVNFLRNLSLESGPRINFSGGLTLGAGSQNIFAIDPLFATSAANPLREAAELFGDTPSDAVILGAGATLELRGTETLHRVTTLQLDAGSSLVGPGSVDTNFFEILGNGGVTITAPILQSSDLATLRGTAPTLVGAGTQLQFVNFVVDSGTQLQLDGLLYGATTAQLFGASITGSGSILSDTFLDVQADISPLLLGGVLLTSGGNAQINNTLLLDGGAVVGLNGNTSLFTNIAELSPGGGVVRNFGTAQLNVESPVTIGTRFENFGFTNIRGGALTLAGGGRLQGAIDTTGPGTDTLTLQGGLFTVGTGTLLMTGESVPNIVEVLAGATLDIDDDAQVDIGLLHLDGGTLVLGQAAGLNLFGDSHWTAGTITNRPRVGVASQVNILGGRFQFLSGGTKTFDGLDIAVLGDFDVFDNVALTSGTRVSLNGGNAHIGGSVAFTDLGSVGSGTFLSLANVDVDSGGSGVTFDVETIWQASRDSGTGARLRDINIASPTQFLRGGGFLFGSRFVLSADVLFGGGGGYTFDDSQGFLGVNEGVDVASSNGSVLAVVDGSSLLLSATAGVPHTVSTLELGPGAISGLGTLQVGALALGGGNIDTSVTATSTVVGSGFTSVNGQLQTGSLDVFGTLGGGGTLSASTASVDGGTLAVASTSITSRLTLLGTSTVLDGNITAGAGALVSVDPGADVTVLGDLTTPDLALGEATVHGPGSITVLSSYSDGGGAGATVLSDGLLLALFGNATFGRDLVLANGAEVELGSVNATLQADIIDAGGAPTRFHVGSLANVLVDGDVVANAPFDNDGLVRVDLASTLHLAGGGVATGEFRLFGGDGSGVLSIESGYAFGAGARTVDFDGDTGARTFVTSTGVLTVQAPGVQVANLSLDGGNVVIDDLASLDVSGASEWNGGNILRGQFFAVDAAGALNIVSGDLLVPLAPISPRAVAGVGLVVQPGATLSLFGDVTLDQGGSVLIQSSTNASTLAGAVFDSGVGFNALAITGRAMTPVGQVFVTDAKAGVFAGQYDVSGDANFGAGGLRLDNAAQLRIAATGSVNLAGGTAGTPALSAIAGGSSVTGLSAGDAGLFRIVSPFASLGVEGAGNSIERLVLVDGRIDMAPAASALSVGEFRWEAGTINGGSQPITTQTLFMTTPGVKTLANGAELRIDNSTAAPPSVWNDGALQFQDGGALVVVNGSFLAAPATPQVVQDVGTAGIARVVVESAGSMSTGSTIDFGVRVDVATGGSVAAGGTTTFSGGGTVGGVISSVGDTRFLAGTFDLVSGGTLQNADGQLLIDGATVRVGPGQSGALEFASFQSGTLLLDGGSLSFSGSWLGGDVQGVSGTGSLSLANLSILEGGPKRIFGGPAVFVLGNVDWFGGDVILDGDPDLGGPSGFTVANAGVLNLLDGSSAPRLLSTDGRGVLIVTNGGRVVRSGGAAPAVIGTSLALDAAGFMDVQSGTLRLEGSSSLGRQVNVAAAGRLEIGTPANVTLGQGGGAFGLGEVVQDGGVVSVAAGTIAAFDTRYALVGGNLDVNGELHSGFGGMLIDGGTVTGSGTTLAFDGLRFLGGNLSGTGQLVVKGGDLTITGASDKVLGGGFVLAYDPKPGLDWRLNNVVFEDGGTANGLFHFDATSNSVTAWSILVDGGSTQTFPATAYSTGFPGHTGGVAGLGQQVTFGQPNGTNPNDRQIRIATVTPLTDAQQVLAIDLAGAQGHEECFNCAPFRNIVSGEVVGTRSTASWTDGNIVLAGGSRFAVRGGGVLDVATPSGVGIVNGAGGGTFEIGLGSEANFRTAGTRLIEAQLDNAGSLFVEDGALVLAGGGLSSGTIGADLGADVQLTTAGNTLLLLDGADVGSLGGATERVGSGTLQVADGATVRSLFDGIIVDGRLVIGAGATLNVASEVLVTTPLPGHLAIVDGAQVSGAGQLLVEAGSTLDVGGNVLLDGVLLGNAGSATFSGVTQLANGARVSNLGTLSVPGTLQLVGPASTFFENAAGGMLDVAGTLLLDTSIDSFGTIAIGNGGSVEVRAGGALGGTVANGAGSGTLGLHVTGPLLALRDGLAITGTGTTRIDAALTQVEAGAFIGIENLQFAGGRIEFLDGGSLQASGEWLSGTFADVGTGTATVQVNGLLAARSGGPLGLEGVDLRVQEGAELQLEDAVLQDSAGTGGRVTIETAGTLTSTGAGAGAIRVFLDVQSGGLLDVGATQLAISGGDIAGTIGITTGTLRADALGAANPLRFLTGSSITGTAGTLEVDGRAVQVADGHVLALPTLRLLSGGVAGAAGFEGDLALAGQLIWEGGSFTGAGSASVAGTTTIATANAKLLDGFTLDIRGGTWSAGDLDLVNGAQLTSTLGTLLVVTPDGTRLASSDGTGSVAFGGTGSISVQMAAPTDRLLVSADVSSTNLDIAGTVETSALLVADTLTLDGATLRGTGGSVLASTLIGSGLFTLDAISAQSTNGTLLGDVTLANGSTLAFTGALDSLGDGPVSIAVQDGGGGTNLLSLAPTATLAIVDATWTVGTTLDSAGALALSGGDLVLTGQAQLAGSQSFTTSGGVGSFVHVRGGSTVFAPTSVAMSAESALVLESGDLAFAGAFDVPRLTMMGGRLLLDAASAPTVSTRMDWTGGTIQRAAASAPLPQLTVLPGGTLAIGAGSAKTIDGAVLAVAGNGTLTNDEVRLANGGRLAVLVGGDFALAGTRAAVLDAAGSTGLLVNAGTFTNLAADGAVNTLASTGTVRVSAGTLTMTPSGTGAVASGLFDLVGGNLVLRGDLGVPYLFQAGSSFTGNGLLRVDGNGELRVDTGHLLAVGNLALASGTINHLGGGSVLEIGSSFDWQAGTITGTGGTTRVLGASSIGAAATHTVSGAHLLQLTGGQWSGGALSLAGNSTVELLGGGTLVTNGPGLQLAGDGSAGNQLLVDAGAVLDASTGLGVGVQLTNLGTVSASGGTLVLNAGGLSTGTLGTAGGSLTLAAGTLRLGNGAVLALASGDANLQAGAALQVLAGDSASVTGSAANALGVQGNLQLGGTLAVGAGGPAVQLQDGATVAGVGNLLADTVQASGTVVVTGAGLSANVLDVAAGANVTAADVSASTLNLAGTLVLDNLAGGDATLRSGTLTVGAFSLSSLDLDAGSRLFLLAGGGGDGRIRDAALLDGVVDVAAGQLLRIEGAGRGTNVLTGAGRIEIDNSGFLLDDGMRIEGTGDRRFTNATLVATSTPLTVAAGSVLVLDGTLGGSGQLLVQGALGTEGTVSVSGTTTVAAGGLLQVSADTPSTATFAMLVNQGLLNLGSDVDPSLDANLVAGSLTNNGNIVAVAGSGTRSISGFLDNVGTLTADTATLSLLDGGTFVNTGTLLGLNGGDFLLASILRFEHNGALTLSAGSTFSLPLGTFVFIGGSVTGGSVDALAVSNVGGANFGSVLTAGQLNVGSGTSLALGNATVTSIQNDGTLSLGGTLSTSGGVTNNGMLTGSGAILGAVTNTSTLDVTGGLSIDALGGAVSNSGTISVAGGQSLAVTNGTFSNSGSISLGSGATFAAAGNFDWTGGALTGGTFSVGGNLTVASGGSQTLGSTLSAGNVTIAGTLGGTGSVNATGNVSITGSAALAGLTAGGGLTVSGGSLDAANVAAASAQFGSGASVNLTALTTSGGVSVDGVETTVALAGLSSNALNVLGGSLATLSGVTNVGSGGITVNGGAHLALAGATVTGGLDLVDGLLTGTGTLNGALVNSGTVAIGNSPGVLVVNGNYTQAADGVLVIEIGGPGAFVPGVTYDQLVVNGTATVDGTLQFVQLEGFTSFAERGDLMPLTYSSITGVFSTVEAIGDPDFVPQIVFGPTGALATAVVAPPGDPEENAGDTSQDVAELADQQDDLENCGEKEDEAKLETQATDSHGVGCRGI